MIPIPTGGIREANPLGCARLAGSEGVDHLASAKRGGPTPLTGIAPKLQGLVPVAVKLRVRRPP
jgi:hypothetical protein